MTKYIAGIPVQATSRVEAVEEFLRLSSKKGEVWRFVNSYCVSLASRDRAYHELLAGSGRNFPDGLPLSVALNRMNNGVRFRQVRGPSFFVDCLDRGREMDLSHFFLGGTDETLRRMCENAQRRFPGVKIAGTHSPAFRPLSDSELAAQDQVIIDSDADVVWVGLGTPKQDFEAFRIHTLTNKPVAAVGAAFDFLAGTKPEAPRVIRRLGLEWAFRLASEPRRLWRRYLYGNLRFLSLISRELVNRTNADSRRP